LWKGLSQPGGGKKKLSVSEKLPRVLQTAEERIKKKKKEQKKRLGNGVSSPLRRRRPLKKGHAFRREIRSGKSAKLLLHPQTNRAGGSDQARRKEEKGAEKGSQMSCPGTGGGTMPS